MADGGGDGRSARWAGHRARRRAELVEAAVDAVAVHGPDVTTEQIAAHAGIARPQLYRHFEHTEDLHRAIADRVAELLLAGMAPALLAAEGDTPRSVVLGAVRAFVGWLTDHPALYRYVLHRTPADPADPAAATVVGDIKRQIAAQAAVLLCAFPTVMEVDPVVANHLAYGMVSLVDAVTHRWLDEPGELGRDELVNHLSGWIGGMLDSLAENSGEHLDLDLPLPVPDPANTD